MLSFISAPVSQPTPTEYVNPCVPSPCGPNAQCKDIGGSPSCSCLINYIGSPPNCRPECVINTECPHNLACLREKCRDPCPGSCGFEAQCNVINHTPVCVCPEGYTGDPFQHCYPNPQPRKYTTVIINAMFFDLECTINFIFTLAATPVTVNKCSPSPCGPNAECRDGSCICLPEYYGDPYFGCRPECVLSTDCERTKACIRNKCTDPCPGTCGQGALCDVVNHIPVCSCPEGTSGNAFVQCRSMPRMCLNLAVLWCVAKL